MNVLNNKTVRLPFPIIFSDAKSPLLPNLPIFIELGSGISCWYEGCECSNTSTHHCDRFLRPAFFDSIVLTC